VGERLREDELGPSKPNSAQATETVPLAGRVPPD
jgi:hypothetical protein